MPWTERQRLMLREMGLRVWQPPHAALPAPPPVNNDNDTARIGAQRPVPPPRGAPAPMPGRRPAREAEARQDSTLTAAPLHAGQGSAGTEAPASAGSVATLDWPALREAVSACRACRLCESRKQTVFGVGHPQAHWMIVGEAPGQQEDEQGEPFVGAAGQLLDAMLHALGLSRQAEGDAAARVFIANTLKCRPPGNRNPQPEEMQRCEPFLVRQIELVRPKLILAMGRFAVQALLRTSEPIGRLRGRAHRYQGVPLVVTYHPAYLLRNLPDKARAWEDLCLAADLMRTDAAP
jgi:DNA polymerase